jgi:hypothetical protein
VRLSHSHSGIYFQVGAVKYTATMLRDIDCGLPCLISHTEARFAAEMKQMQFAAKDQGIKGEPGLDHNFCVSF